MHKIKIQENVEENGKIKSVIKTYNIPFVISCPNCKATVAYLCKGKDYSYKCTRPGCDFEMSGEDYAKQHFVEAEDEQ